MTAYTISRRIGKKLRRIRELGFTDGCGKWHGPWDSDTESQRLVAARQGMRVYRTRVTRRVGA